MRLASNCTCRHQPASHLTVNLPGPLPDDGVSPVQSLLYGHSVGASHGEPLLLFTRFLCGSPQWPWPSPETSRMWSTVGVPRPTSIPVMTREFSWPAARIPRILLGFASASRPRHQANWTGGRRSAPVRPPMLTSWTAPLGWFDLPWCCLFCCCWGLPVW